MFGDESVQYLQRSPSDNIIKSRLTSDAVLLRDHADNFQICQEKNPLGHKTPALTLVRRPLARPANFRSISICVGYSCDNYCFPLSALPHPSTPPSHPLVEPPAGYASSVIAVP